MEITTNNLIFNLILLYTILLYRSPELLVQIYYTSSLIMVLVFVLVSLHGD